MNKKLIIIGLALGLVGFGGMFAFAWFTMPKAIENSEVNEAVQANAAEPAQQQAESVQKESTAERIAAMAGQSQQSISDQQLETLVFEIREKIKEYNVKLKDIEAREKRFQAAQDDLKKDIQEMLDLRVELASVVTNIKNEQNMLARTKLEIEKSEQQNLVAIAATYDKMDAESAGKILMNMVKNDKAVGSSDDAVKILYYMTERTKAKVLAAMAQAEPEVSAFICQKLKRMVAEES